VPAAHPLGCNLIARGGRKCAQCCYVKTVGEIREASDATLLSFQYLSPSVARLRDTGASVLRRRHGENEKG
jgi:hypothetical protein